MGEINLFSFIFVDKLEKVLKVKVMKKLFLSLILAVGCIIPASAQYSDIVNGLTNVVLPAIQGGANYKGYVEADATFGVGEYRTNFLTFATSQGYQFNSWFYMGAGIGVDMLWSNINSGWADNWNDGNPGWYNHEKTTFAVMIPVFSDFRFILGAQNVTSFFINFRVGAAFLCSDSYVQIRDGYLTNQNYFYFQPAIGLRIPVNKTRPRQALDIGIHYRLMTSDYWGGTWQKNAYINGLGLNVSYEW